MEVSWIASLRESGVSEETLMSMGKGIRALVSSHKELYIMDCSREWTYLHSLLNYTPEETTQILKNIFSDACPDVGDMLTTLYGIQKMVLAKKGIFPDPNSRLMPDNRIMDLGYAIYMKLRNHGLFLHRGKGQEDYPFFVQYIDHRIVCLKLDHFLLQDKLWQQN